MMNLEIMKERFRYAQVSLRPNYRLIPCSALGVDEEAVETFNEILNWVKSLGLRRLVRTKSGGISIDRKKYHGCGWDITNNSYCVEIVIIYYGMWRIQFRNKSVVSEEDGKEKEMYGRQAFMKFRNECKKRGIELGDYEIDNGEEVKKEIEKPMISVSSPRVLGNTYFSAHHIDFHNSYPAGLVNTHPEFRDVVEMFYKGRKENPEYKAVLNLTVGYMQSVKGCGAKWAHLSRDAIRNNNERMRELSERLIKSGRKILAYNTDGIWYTGEVYHGSGEGKNLGDWENDHVNCMIRFRSKGAYEYMENGVYTPVVRGLTGYDKVKPRSEWEWGDIFRKDAEVIMYKLTEDGLEIIK